MGGSKRVRGSEREREREESTRVCVCAIGTLENWTYLRKVQTLLLFKQRGFILLFAKVNYTFHFG